MYQKKEMAKKLFVRSATSADEAAIFAFYGENKHRNVFQRDPDVWKERFASGAATIIHDDHGKIIAAAVIYPIMKKEPDGQETHQWSEIGSVRISMEDAGLFKYLICAHVLRAYLLEPPADRFVVEIDLDNTHSKHVFQKAGAMPYVVPKDLEDAVMETVDPNEPQPPVDWFHMGAEVMPQLAKDILAFSQNPTLQRKLTGEEYEIDYSRSVIMTHFKPAVEALANQDFGDIKNPAISNSIKSSRHKLGL